MRNTLLKTVAFALLTFIVTACGGPAATPTPAPTPTPVAAAVPIGGQRTFVIAPAESKASYVVHEEFFAGALAKLGIDAGKKTVTGSTQEIEGQLQLNLDNLAGALGDNTFTVKMNTLTTDQANRDQWIREHGPTFNQFPQATFKATSIEGAPASYTAGDEVSFKLAGDLTVHGVTKPVTFDVKAKLTGDTLTGSATTAQLKISDFGIEPPSFANTLTVADELEIQVQFTAREKK